MAVLTMSLVAILYKYGNFASISIQTEMQQGFDLSSCTTRLSCNAITVMPNEGLDVLPTNGGTYSLYKALSKRLMNFSYQKYYIFSTEGRSQLANIDFCNLLMLVESSLELLSYSAAITHRVFYSKTSIVTGLPAFTSDFTQFHNKVVQRS